MFGLRSIDAISLYRRLFIALAIAAAISASLVVVGRSLIADDDNLWLAMATLKLTARAEATALEDRVIATLREQKADPESVLRFQQRREYINNYIGAIALWRVAASLVPSPATADEAQTLAIRLLVMFGIGTACAWLLLALVLGRVGDTAVVAGVALGLSVIALWAATFAFRPNPMLGLLKSLWLLLPSILGYLIKPPDGFSVFGFTGRNLFAIVFLAVIVLRWAGKFGSAAVIFACSFALHASLALLMFPFIVLADMLSRPSLLRTPSYAVPLALGLCYGLAMESLWQTTLDTKTVVVIALATTILGGASAALMNAGVRASIRNLLPSVPVSLYHRVAALKPVSRDMVVFACVWGVTLVPVIMILQFADPFSVTYFWSQIHARALGVLQPIFACGAAILLVRRFSPGPVAMLLLASMATAAIGAAITIHSGKDSALRRLTHEIEAIKRFIASGGTELTGMPQANPTRVPAYVVLVRENVLYFGIERTLATKEDRFTPVLAVAIRGTR